MNKRVLLLVFVAFAVSGFFCKTDAALKLPSIPGVKLPSILPSASGSPQKAKPVAQNVADEIKSAQQELTEETAPEGSTPTEWQERNSVLQSIVREGKQFQNAQSKSSLTANSLPKDLQAKGPPYSIRTLDELRDILAAQRLQTDALLAEERITKEVWSSSQTEAKDSGSALRQAAEAMLAAKNKPDAARKKWLHTLADLKNRAAKMKFTADDARLNALKSRVAEAQKQQEQIQDKLAAWWPETHFNKKELAQILAELKTQIASYSKAVQQAVQAQSAAQNALTTAQKSTGGQGTAGKESLNLRQLQAESANIHLTLEQWMTAMLLAEQKIWEKRFTTDSGNLDGQTSEMEKGISEGLDRVREMQGLLNLRQKANDALLDDLTQKISQFKSDSPEKVIAQAVLKEYQQRQHWYHKVETERDRLQRLISYWKTDFTLHQQNKGWWQRWRQWRHEAWKEIHSIWSYEVVASGEQNSVTVGKLISALILLIIGFLVSRIVSRMMEKSLSRRIKINPMSAEVLRKWGFFVFFLIFVMFVLRLVNIPLTLFAFLAGALALGLGFGTQNLVSNFISGIILMFERPIRLNDVVVIDNVTGTVVELGLRATRIKGFDGYEYQIPNRNFLENVLANRSFTDKKVRYTISIGVAYGTPIRKVKDALEKVVAEHGVLMKDPAPLVVLDAFYEQSMKFQVYYWLDVGQGVNPLSVASDLRIMAEQKLEEQEISVTGPYWREKDQ